MNAHRWFVRPWQGMLFGFLFCIALPPCSADAAMCSNFDYDCRALLQELKAENARLATAMSVREEQFAAEQRVARTQIEQLRRQNASLVRELDATHARNEQLASMLTAARNELSQTQQSFDAHRSNMKETLAAFAQKSAEMERVRVSTIQTLRAEISTLHFSTQDLSVQNARLKAITMCLFMSALYLLMQQYRGSARRPQPILVRRDGGGNGNGGNMPHWRGRSPQERTHAPVTAALVSLAAAVPSLLGGADEEEKELPPDAISEVSDSENEQAPERIDAT